MIFIEAFITMFVHVCRARFDLIRMISNEIETVFRYANAASCSTMQHNPHFIHFLCSPFIFTLAHTATYLIVYSIICAQFNHYDTVSFGSGLFMYAESADVATEIQPLRYTHVFSVCENIMSVCFLLCCCCKILLSSFLNCGI